MADKTTTETPAVETETVETAPKFTKQVSTILSDEQLVADLTTLSALKQHANPSEMVRAAVTFYRDQNAGKIARFREFIEGDDSE